MTVGRAGVRGSTRGDAAPKADHVSGGAAGSTHSERSRSATHLATSHPAASIPATTGSWSARAMSLACPAVESTRRCRLTTHQIRVGARATCRHAVRLVRQPPHRDVEAGRLAETGRYADHRRPPLALHDAGGKARLPGKRITPVDGPVECGECGRRRNPLRVNRPYPAAGCGRCVSHQPARRGRNRAAARRRQRPARSRAPRSGTRRENTGARAARAG